MDLSFLFRTTIRLQVEQESAGCVLGRLDRSGSM